MIICATCGKSNENFFKFCLGCGAELAHVPKLCPNAECATPFPDGAGFCPKCGTSRAVG